MRPLLYVRESKDSSVVAKTYRRVVGTSAPAPAILTAPTINADALVGGVFIVSQ